MENYGTVRQATYDNVIRRKRIWCWIIPNATDTHWEHIILTAFPRKQWLRERASFLRYTQSAFLVKINITRSDHSALWPRRFTTGKEPAEHILVEAAGSQLSVVHYINWNVPAPTNHSKITCYNTDALLLLLLLFTHTSLKPCVNVPHSVPVYEMSPFLLTCQRGAFSLAFSFKHLPLLSSIVFTICRCLIKLVMLGRPICHF